MQRVCHCLCVKFFIFVVVLINVKKYLYNINFLQNRLTYNFLPLMNLLSSLHMEITKFVMKFDFLSPSSILYFLFPILLLSFLEEQKIGQRDRAMAIRQRSESARGTLNYIRAQEWGVRIKRGITCCVMKREDNDVKNKKGL